MRRFGKSTRSVVAVLFASLFWSPPPIGRSSSAISVGPVVSTASAASAASDDPLLGTTAAEWQVGPWINGPPLTLRGLRGQVVLVRWWTAPDCPYCHATAPALNEFDHDFRARGLRVVGFYHHKSDDPLRIADVKRWTREFGFQFPVAIDPDWRTLKRWWMNAGGHDFTSVSFLIDKRGVIRFIHPGGQFVKGDPGYAKLKMMIETLVAEK